MTARSGFALVLALLLALALSLLGLGALAVGVRETAIAGAIQRREVAVARARAVVLDAARTWSTRTYSELPVGGQRSLPAGPGADLRVFRLDTALYLLRSEGRFPGATARSATTARTGLLVRTLDPERAARRFTAAAAAGGEAEILGGTVSGLDPCDGGHDALVAPVVTLGPGAGAIEGAVRIDSVPVPEPFTPEIVSRLDVLPLAAGAIAPTPDAVGTTCTSTPTNWGSPDPSHPCHDRLPVIAADGPLVVAGGTGRAILIVEGDLVVTDDALLHGLVIASGRAVIDGGARIRGALWADRLTLRNGGIQRDGCELRAVLGGRALDRGFRPRGRRWVAVF